MSHEGADQDHVISWDKHRLRAIQTMDGCESDDGVSCQACCDAIITLRKLRGPKGRAVVDKFFAVCADGNFDQRLRHISRVMKALIDVHDELGLMVAKDHRLAKFFADGLRDTNNDAAVVKRILDALTYCVQKCSPPQANQAIVSAFCETDIPNLCIDQLDRFKDNEVVVEQAFVTILQFVLYSQCKADILSSNLMKLLKAIGSHAENAAGAQLGSLAIMHCCSLDEVTGMHANVIAGLDFSEAIITTGVVAALYADVCQKRDEILFHINNSKDYRLTLIHESCNELMEFLSLSSTMLRCEDLAKKLWITEIPQQMFNMGLMVMTLIIEDVLIGERVLILVCAVFDALGRWQLRRGIPSQLDGIFKPFAERNIVGNLMHILDVVKQNPVYDHTMIILSVLAPYLVERIETSADQMHKCFIHLIYCVAQFSLRHNVLVDFPLSVRESFRLVDAFMNGDASMFVQSLLLVEAETESGELVRNFASVVALTSTTGGRARSKRAALAFLARENILLLNRAFEYYGVTLRENQAAPVNDRAKDAGNFDQMIEPISGNVAPNVEQSNAEAEDDSHLCRTCNRTSTDMQACGRCKNVFYCNRDCQRRDWSRHKTECSSG